MFEPHQRQILQETQDWLRTQIAEPGGPIHWDQQHSWVNINGVSCETTEEVDGCLMRTSKVVEQKVCVAGYMTLRSRDFKTNLDIQTPMHIRDYATILLNIPAGPSVWLTSSIRQPEELADYLQEVLDKNSWTP